MLTLVSKLKVFIALGATEYVQLKDIKKVKTSQGTDGS
jgi:hypothetical protein